MNDKLTSSLKSQPRWLKFLIFTLLLLGIFLRFFNLGQKAYWTDEANTSLRISGYTRVELIQELYDGRIIGVEDILKFQHVNPNKGIIATIKSLAKETPQMPPLYFSLLRVWVNLFGDNIAIIRSLSALISLLAFPCIYWLCLELFGSSLAGWLGVMIIAVSPFHLVYAQEARPYSLWTVIVLLSSASFLRAIRLRTKSSWGIYAITIALGFYSHIFHAFVVAAHTLYITLIKDFRKSKIFSMNLLASLLGFATFIPWIIIILNYMPQVSLGMYWVKQKIPLYLWAKLCLFNLSSLFIDFNFNVSNLNTPLVYPFFFFAAYSILFVCLKAQKRIWLFIVTLFGVSTLSLILPDLIFGGLRSIVHRYLIPGYLAIQLSIVYLFSIKIIPISINDWRHKLWCIIMSIFMLGGAISCIVITQSKEQRDKFSGNFYFEVAKVINKTEKPLLITDTLQTYRILGLSQILNHNVKLILVDKPNKLKIPENFTEIFLYLPSARLLNSIRDTQSYKISPIQKLGRFHNKLWQLEKYRVPIQGNK